MERMNFGYSLKNIPIPSSKSYKLKLIEKTESFIKRMRWKAHFFLQENEEGQESMKRENYGFMTRKCPPQCADLDNFEKDLMNVINKLEFKKINDKFQRKLKEDIKKVRESPNMLVFADKSTNVYELKPEDHQKFLQNNITKTYKKASEMIEHEINLEAKQIAEKLELEDRINCL